MDYDQGKPIVNKVQVMLERIGRIISMNVARAGILIEGQNRERDSREIERMKQYGKRP